MLDRTTTIRASVHDVERTLIGSIFLVVLVVFFFLRSPRATLIPSVAVPVSLIGTFAVMYLLGYSLDNLSLMALTIATGFVVDDAIVVMENITRHLEAGMEPFAAALKGAQEIGFTVFSISMSLIAVFIPILMMGGIVGPALPRIRRHAFHRHPHFDGDFAHHHAHDVRAPAEGAQARTRSTTGFYRTSEKVLQRHDLCLPALARWVLDNPVLMLIVLGLTIALNVVMLVKIPKGFFPQQDTGSIVGGVQGPQDASFPFMNFSIL